MVHLRHYKYKNEQLNSTGMLKVKNGTLEWENDCRPINIYINVIDKFQKRRTKKEEKIYKKHLAQFLL